MRMFQRSIDAPAILAQLVPGNHLAHIRAGKMNADAFARIKAQVATAMR